MSDIGRDIGDAMAFFAILAAFGILFAIGGVMGFALLAFGFPSAAMAALVCGFIGGIVGAFLMAREAA